MGTGGDFSSGILELEEIGGIFFFFFSSTGNVSGSIVSLTSRPTGFRVCNVGERVGRSAVCPPILECMHMFMSTV